MSETLKIYPNSRFELAGGLRAGEDRTTQKRRVQSPARRGACVAEAYLSREPCAYRGGPLADERKLLAGLIGDMLLKKGLYG
jgi:hypothetical protein